MVQNLRVARLVYVDVVVVTVAGDVDIGTAGLLEKGLTAARLIALPPSAMVVDLRAVRFFGAAGLTALVRIDNNCREQGVVLQIMANQRSVLRPLEITGLIDLLPVVATLRPEWAKRQRPAPASRVVLDAARRVLLADNSEKSPALVD
jgi:anti-sigma B factor antagonist